MILHDKLPIDDRLADQFYASGRKLAQYNLIDNWSVNPIPKTDYWKRLLTNLLRQERRCLLGYFNLCLQKIETCNYSRDFLLALQSCYPLPTIDKPTLVHKNSASLIDNIFVNNPEQVLISGNLITDVSDHFSQFCILTSTRDKIKRKQIKKRNVSLFNPDSLNSDLATIDSSCIIKRHANNVEELFSTFYRNFNKIINKHAPFLKPFLNVGLNNFLSLGLQKV